MGAEDPVVEVRLAWAVAVVGVRLARAVAVVAAGVGAGK